MTAAVMAKRKVERTDVERRLRLLEDQVAVLQPNVEEEEEVDRDDIERRLRYLADMVDVVTGESGT